MIRPDLVVLQFYRAFSVGQLCGGSSCSVGDGCWPGMSVSRGVRQSRLSLAGRLLLGPVFGIGFSCFFCRPGHLQYVLGKTGCQPFLGPEL